MIVVRVELHSAVTGRVTEIGRVVISNDESGSAELGNYEVSLVDDSLQLRNGRVERHERSLPIWLLVQRALASVFEPSTES